MRVMTETFYAAIFGYDEVSCLYNIEHTHMAMSKQYIGICLLLT